ncbi:malonate transporter [Pseudarthrobacter siccitolerans]|uniref:Malonate transporter n=1 Tax=Pseudarthrobacter siccitolerans TaxID=861266 RepID=A0ABU0PL57_9MICC|nr:AEC family transporter [Pseudarthrobacter siccitolerans]MDQ0674710.1 malonate transporter [Pseudarthrobacter siccitolerans]
MLVEVFLKVLPLFLGILVGYLASYWPRFQENAEPAISAFVFYIALPALLFVVAAKADLGEGIPPAFPALIVAVTVGVSLVSFVPLWIISKRDLPNSIAATLSATYGNVSYLGIPVVLGILGTAGGLPAVIGQLVHNLIFLLGYPVLHELLFSQRADRAGRWKAITHTVYKAMVCSPLIWAIVLGIAVSTTKISVFAPLMEFTSMLAGAAAPGALFAIGLSLRGAVRVFRGGKLRLTPVWAAGVAKLILMPAATAAAALIFAPDIPHPWLITLIIMAGMPTSATAYVLSQTSGGDGRTVAAIILVTNFFGIVTLPIAAQLFT